MIAYLTAYEVFNEIPPSFANKTQIMKLWVFWGIVSLLSIPLQPGGSFKDLHGNVRPVKIKFLRMTAPFVVS